MRRNIHRSNSCSRRARRVGPLLARGASLLLAAFAAGAAVVSVPASLATVPEPEPVARRWELELKSGGLRAITLEVPGRGSQSYLFMTYTVTNRSDEDVLFAPIFELATPEGELVRSGRDVPPEATKAIVERLNNPLVQDQISILGTIQRGESGAKEGVVIWPLPNVALDSLQVYIAGLSGETKTVEVIDPKTKQPKRATLRKTRMLRFRMPGDVLAQGGTPFDVAEDRWIMR